MNNFSNTKKFQDILYKNFMQHISFENGEIFFVGGCVRDHILEKTPKDIDIVIRNIEFNNLVKILSQYGKVDVVGASFGVIKFKEFETDFEIEIALPRIDTKNQLVVGHKGIIANSNPYLSIEQDLFRRDFTINSIALDSSFNYIDPFGGIKDLKAGVIKATNPEAFKDDPLRMLRAIQFAARFKFEISPATFEMIKLYKSMIKNISSERILMEFQKVFDKQGSLKIFYKLLCETELFESIFSFKNDKLKYNIETASSLAEFLFFCVAHQLKYRGIAEFLRNQLKVDNDTFKICKALEAYFYPFQTANYDIDDFFTKKLMFVCFQISKDIDKCNATEYDFNFYNNMNYPKSYNEIALTGDHLISLGYTEGPKIGEIRRALLEKILKDEIANTYQSCLMFVEENFAEL